MPSTKAEGVLRVNVWNLLDDGIEAPIKGGIYKAQKYSDLNLTDEQEELLAEKIHEYLMNWFSETFVFGDE